MNDFRNAYIRHIHTYRRVLLGMYCLGLLNACAIYQAIVGTTKTIYTTGKEVGKSIAISEYRKREIQYLEIIERQQEKIKDYGTKVQQNNTRPHTRKALKKEIKRAKQIASKAKQGLKKLKTNCRLYRGRMRCTKE